MIDGAATEFADLGAVAVFVEGVGGEGGGGGVDALLAAIDVGEAVEGVVVVGNIVAAGGGGFCSSEVSGEIIAVADAAGELAADCCLLKRNWNRQAVKVAKGRREFLVARRVGFLPGVKKEQSQENGCGTLQIRKYLSNHRLWEKAEIVLTHCDIVGSVSHFLPNSLRKSALAFHRTFLG